MNQPTPAIVAQSAVHRLPRWVLLVLCLAYVVPGFLGRHPWRGADMAALGYMLELTQGHTPWLAPLLGGQAPESDGLLAYWLGAGAIQLLGPLLPPELAARLPFVLLMVLTIVATWHAIYALARRPGAQPVAFAFGGEARPTDYARAIADGGLLALLACLGLAQPAHETTSYLVQLCCTALVFYGLSATPAHWRAGAAALAAGSLGLTLSGAPALALLYPLGAAALLRWAPKAPSTETLHTPHWWLVLLAVALGSAMLTYGLDLWRWRLAWPWEHGREWLSLARLLLWFTWPAWPLALWTLWRWRRHWRQHHVLLPLWLIAVSLVCTMGTEPADRALLLSLPALAALASLALPTLGRSMAALIDWFTLLFFSISAIAIWVIWISTQTGIPAKPAANVAKLARGFVPEFSLLACLLALAATGAWCALVWWRAGRHRSALWKSLVLPAAGTTLCWLLLTTLWMPMLDYARSDVPQMQTLARLAQHPACMQMYGLDRTQIAALQFHGQLRLEPMQPDSPCDWLVVAPPNPNPPTFAKAPPPLPPPQLQGWVWQAGVDRPTGRTDILELYRRSPSSE